MKVIGQKPVAMCDTGLEWCGYKMFLLLPVKLDAPKPSEVIPAFRKDMKMLSQRITIDDFYRVQKVVLNKIVNGVALVN